MTREEVAGLEHLDHLVSLAHLLSSDLLDGGVVFEAAGIHLLDVQQSALQGFESLQIGLETVVLGIQEDGGMTGEVAAGVAGLEGFDQLADVLLLGRDGRRLVGQRPVIQVVTFELVVTDDLAVDLNAQQDDGDETEGCESFHGLG